MLGPVRPPLVVLVGVGGVVRWRGLPLSGPSGLPCWGGLPFLSSPRWRGRGFFFLLLVFTRGERLPLVGGRVRHRHIAGTLSCPRPSSSWTSSPAPHKVPEPVASLREQGLDL